MIFCELRLPKLQAALPLPIHAAVSRQRLRAGHCHRVEQVSIDIQFSQPWLSNQRLAKRRCTSCWATAAQLEASESQVDGADISYTEEAQPRSNLLLKFTVPAARCRKAWEKALKAVSRDLNVPGFRPGKKIPESVVIQQIGKDALQSQALSRIMDSCFTLITDKYKEQAYGESITILANDDVLKDFSKDKDFSFQASIDLYPTLSWLADYHHLKVDVPEVGNEETDQEATKERIWAALKQKGSLRVVADRGLEKGDVAIVDFEARRGNGEAIAGSEKKGMQVDTMDENAIFGIEGIVRALTGKRAGDKVQGVFRVTDPWWERLDGETSLDCSLEIKEVLGWDVPELTDDVAKELLPGVQGVDDLWSQMIEAQRTLTREDLAQNVNNALVAAVGDIVECDVPEFLIRQAAENEYQRRLLEYQSSGRLDRAAVEQLATEEMLLQFMEHNRTELEHLQKGVLGVEAIFQQEKFTVPEEDIRKEAEAALEEAKMAKQDLDEERLMSQIYETLKGVKVMQFLTEISDVNIICKEVPLEIGQAAEERLGES